MYKIFYLNKAFLLSDSPCEKIKNIKIGNINDLCLALREWQEEEEEFDLCFYGSKPEVMMRYLKEFYKYVEAAGGVVKNPKGEYLFIKRFGIWDLPKGKIEKGESPQQAAIREVEEETGIENLTIVKPLANSWHIYPWKETTILKQTYWFLMKSDFREVLTPQINEDITEAQWLSPADATLALNSSYRSLRETIPAFKISKK